MTDALGSVIALTDDSGVVKTAYTYDPFGNVTVSGEASDNPFQYTGRENDGTGLYYYRARYYSPELQRYISEDPIGLFGGINFYRYVGNSPLNYRDPRGELAAPLHYLVTYSATLPFGGPALSSILALQVVLADVGTQGTDAASANRHAMAGWIIEKGKYRWQTPQEAEECTKKFIHDSLNKGNIADAIHATQDLATSVHAGQIWNGSITREHLLGDISPSSIIPAYVNTIRILFYFLFY